MFQQLRQLFQNGSFPSVTPEQREKIKERKNKLKVHELWVKKVVSKRDYDSYYKYNFSYYPLGKEKKGVKLAYIVAREVWDRYPYLRNDPKSGEQVVFPLTDEEYQEVRDRDYSGWLLKRKLFARRLTKE